MNNRWNPNDELFDRPVPPGMVVDVSGLVESWVIAAEDWIFAYSGSDMLTPREAFEGIECWGRLARCDSGLLRSVEGTETLQKLTETIGRSLSHFLELAIQFPDLTAWLHQAQTLWDDDSDDSEATDQLLIDLDAADYLSWVAAQLDKVLPEFEDSLSECHQWLSGHSLMFILSEPLVRATAKTIAGDVVSADPSGGLAMSTLKYLTLLDRAELAWEDSVPKPRSVRPNHPRPKTSPYGRSVLDWDAPVLAATAASSKQFLTPKRPMQWHDANGKFEATTVSPNAIEPDGSTTIEMSFGTGDQYLDSATELVGARVRLGGAEGVIESRKQGDADFVFVALRYRDIVALSGSRIDLFVNGEQWE